MLKWQFESRIELLCCFHRFEYVVCLPIWWCWFVSSVTDSDNLVYTHWNQFSTFRLKMDCMQLVLILVDSTRVVSTETVKSQNAGDKCVPHLSNTSRFWRQQTKNSQHQKDVSFRGVDLAWLIFWFIYHFNYFIVNKI